MWRYSLPVAKVLSLLGKRAGQLPPARRRWSIHDAIAPPLLLAAPLLVFLEHNGYPLLRTETLLIYAGIAVVGGSLGLLAGAGGRLTRSLLIALLITLFVDIQFDDPNWWGIAVAFTVPFGLTWYLGSDTSRILAAAAAAFIVAGLVLPTGDDPLEASAQVRPAAAPRASAANLPVLVHLILDEHIGTEGIPPDLEGARELKEKLIAFYPSNGFRLFGRAYSEYFDTFNSIPHTMNFEPDSYNPELVSRIRGPYDKQMNHNEYLRRLHELGFLVHVSQTTYLNFCEDGPVTADECKVGNYTSLEAFSRTPLSALQKIRAIFSLYVERSFLYEKLKKFNRELYELTRDRGINVPLIAWERDGRGTFLGMEQLEGLRRQLVSAQPGEAYFAHVLLPHHPYVYRADCSLRAPDDWLQRDSESAPKGTNNTPQTRSGRYEAYLEQVACVASLLGDIFDAMRAAGTYRDALIVIHGDHGSRIGLVDPSVDVVDRMADTDFLDAFSALFAIKGPGIEPGYDLSTRSIQELVASWAAADFGALPKRVDDEGPAWVFLEGQGDRWVRYPWEGFAGAARQSESSTSNLVERARHPPDRVAQ